MSQQGFTLLMMAAAAVRRREFDTPPGPVEGPYDFLVETTTYTPPAGNDVDFLVET